MKIVIGYNGTRLAKAALDVSAKMCKAFEAQAHIVNSVFVRDTPGEKFEFIDNNSAVSHKVKNQAESNLAEATKHLQNEGISCEKHLLNRGLEAGEDIITFAKEIGATFIVIGVRRRSKLGKLIFGSTAQFVILNADCPVITV